MISLTGKSRRERFSELVDNALKNKWQPVVRWMTEYRAGQQKVFAEEAVLVGLDRMCGHVGIETGYTGDPNSISRGVNQCCPNPGKDCTADCRAYGLFQIFWPPFSGVDFSKNKLLDPGYNSYLGAKTLAVNYKACGRDWTKASRKFFTGNCEFTGTVDPSTGTTEEVYLSALKQNMDELHSLGISTETGKAPTPDQTPGPTNNGNGNTPTDASQVCTDILGQHICVPKPSLSTDAITGIVTPYFDRAILLLVGALILIVGLYLAVG
jgi:hypothetical protein